MGTTPVLVKGPTQANTTDAAVGPGGSASQRDGQVVGLANGGYLVVWTDESRAFNPDGTAVIGQRYDAQGERVGGEFSASRFVDGDQFSPALTAFPAGGFAVAFVDNPGGDNDIYVERYDANLNWVGTDQVTAGPNNIYQPSITAFADGSRAVAYTVGSGTGTDIAARIVSAAGVAGAQFEIHNDTRNADFSQLATLSDGNFVAVFQDEFGGTDTDIGFRIFTATGTPVSSGEFVPGAFSSSGEFRPDVAALTGGGFVVVWTDFGTTVSDIYATVLTNAGGTVRSDILVNATQAGSQYEPSVVGLADGGFLVTWNDDNPNLVRAQRFDAGGNPVGDQFTVGGFSPGRPEAARLADGHIAFSFDHTGADSDVFTSVWNPRGTVAAVGDVLWRQTDGTVAIAARELGSVPTNWEVEGTGDFDADGDGDILWRHEDGLVVTWELQNGQLLANHNIAFASIGWDIQGLGDFDGDGDSDVIWRHQDGAVVTWEMENNDYVVNHNIAFASVGGRIDGTGDFDGDGDDDIIWRHQDGDVVTWEMENGAYVQNHNIATASTTWQINGTGDFDGDGDADILWRHDEGAVVFWEMQGGDFVTSHSLPDVATTYQIRGTEDFDSDGDTDILWRHQDGTLVTWEMDGGNVLQTHNFGLTGNDWQIRGTGEFDLL